MALCPALGEGLGLSAPVTRTLEVAAALCLAGASRREGGRCCEPPTRTGRTSHMDALASTGKAEAALLLGALGAAVLTFQSWGTSASLVAAALVGVVGARRGLSLPAALAAGSAAGAALVHFAVSPEHFGEWWGFGLFFVLCGEVQLGWALWLGRRYGRGMFVLGIGGSLFLVAVWALSRLTGLPFGPEPGVPEAVGVPDVVSVVLELGTAGACAWALLAPARVRVAESLTARAVGLAGAVALTAWALASVGAA